LKRDSDAPEYDDEEFLSLRIGGVDATTYNKKKLEYAHH
jgi:hypothetical protein